MQEEKVQGEPLRCRFQRYARIRNKSRNHSKTEEMPAGGEGEVTGVKKVM